MEDANVLAKLIEEMRQESILKLAEQIEKLNKLNYIQWKRDIQLLLIRAKIWNVITNEPPKVFDEKWEAADDMALLHIHLACTPEFKSMIADCPNAKEAWNKLRSNHDRYNAASLNRLTDDFINATNKG